MYEMSNGYVDLPNTEEYFTYLFSLNRLPPVVIYKRKAGFVKTIDRSYWLSSDI